MEKNYNKKEDIKILLTDIEFLIKKRFGKFIEDKEKTESILFDLPIVQNLLLENKNLFNKIKELEIKLLEKKVDDKVRLKVSEIPHMNNTKNIYINDNIYSNNKKRLDNFDSNLQLWNNDLTSSESESGSDIEIQEHINSKDVRKSTR